MVAASSLIAVAVAGVATAAVIPAVFAGRRGRRRWIGWSGLGAAVTAVLSGVVLLMWFQGSLASTPIALGLAVLAAVPGSVIATRGSGSVRPATGPPAPVHPA